MTFNSNDHYWMSLAYQQALLAEKNDEVPVGAVLVRDLQVIGVGSNSPIGDCDPSAHAEINAIRHAAKAVGNYRLPGSALYVTVEPCTMCFGLMVHARIERLVYAAAEPKAGVVNSRLQLIDKDFYNHRIDCRSGVLELQSAELMADFFRRRRSR